MPLVIDYYHHHKSTTVTHTFILNLARKAILYPTKKVERTIMRPKKPIPPSIRSDRIEPNRNLRMSTRSNAMFKWKHDITVVGALEMDMHFGWEPDAPLIPLKVPSTTKDEFDDCFRIWKEQKLEVTLREALKSIPPETNCCGFITDPEETIRGVVPLLNHGWAKRLNSQQDSIFRQKGYSVDAYVWSWSHLSGTAETVRLLIRFHYHDRDSSPPEQYSKGHRHD